MYPLPVYEHRVTLRASEDAPPFSFMCWAMDDEDAREQALKAYPGYEVMEIEFEPENPARFE